MNLVAELYDILELKSPGVEVTAVSTAKNYEERSERMHSDKKNTRPPIEFVFVTPIEKGKLIFPDPQL